MNARPTTRTRSVSAGVPAYAASGRRLRRYSRAAAERILALDPPTAFATRNRRTGQITSLQFLPLPKNSAAVEGKEPLRKSAHMGQCYSFAEQLGDGSGHRAWRHARLLTPHGAEDELYLMQIFRAVPLSCLVVNEPSEPVSEPSELVSESAQPEPPEPPPASNVVTMRPRRKSPAPVAYGDATTYRRAA